MPCVLTAGRGLTASSLRGPAKPPCPSDLEVRTSRSYRTPSVPAPTPPSRDEVKTSTVSQTWYQSSSRGLCAADRDPSGSQQLFNRCGQPFSVTRLARDLTGSISRGPTSRSANVDSDGGVVTRHGGPPDATLGLCVTRVPGPAPVSTFGPRRTLAPSGSGLWPPCRTSRRSGSTSRTGPGGGGRSGGSATRRGKRRGRERTRKTTGGRVVSDGAAARPASAVRLPGRSRHGSPPPRPRLTSTPAPP